MAEFEAIPAGASFISRLLGFGGRVVSGGSKLAEGAGSFAKGEAAATKALAATETGAAAEASADKVATEAAKSKFGKQLGNKIAVGLTGHEVVKDIEKRTGMGYGAGGASAPGVGGSSGITDPSAPTNANLNPLQFGPQEPQQY